MAALHKFPSNKLVPRQDAAVLAAAMWRQPSLARPSNRHTPAHNVLAVIKIAAGDDDTIAAHDGLHGLAAREWPEAAVLYLQATLLSSAEHDHHAVLGLPQEPSEDLIRQHKRWLLKWLHPDRNPNRWQTTLFLRVQKAAEAIGRGEIPDSPVSPVAASRPVRDAAKRDQRITAAAPKLRKRQPRFALFQLVGIPALIVVMAIALIVFFGQTGWGVVANNLPTLKAP